MDRVREKREIKDFLEVQRDMFILDEEELTEKYVPDIHQYKKFLSGVKRTLGPMSYNYYLDYSRGDKIHSVVVRGADAHEESIPLIYPNGEIVEDLSIVLGYYDLERKDRKYNYDLREDAMGTYEYTLNCRYNIPGRSFKDMLIDMPEQFERVLSTSSVTKIDAKYASAVAYLFGTFPEFMSSLDNCDTIIDSISKTNVRDSRTGDFKEDRMFRRTAKRARSAVENYTKQLEKGTAKKIEK